MWALNYRKIAARGSKRVSKDSVVIIGAGGHAKVVLELLRDAGATVVGLTDANPRGGDILGAPVLGDDTILPALFESGVRSAFVALGDNHRRFQMGERVQQLGFNLVNAISPYARISVSAQLGRGVAVMAGATVNAEAQIGDLSIVNTNAGVDHDAVLEAACHVGPGVALAGGVRIGRWALLGAGSSVIPNCSVGEGAIVGAGACVVRDIGPNMIAVGVPATIVRVRSGFAG